MAEQAHSTPVSALLRATPLSLWPEAVQDRRRRLEAGLVRLEALQAEMIERLDALTPDPDLEPSLGAPEFRGASANLWMRTYHPGALAWAKGSTDEREGEGGLPHGDADFEWSIDADEREAAGEDQEGDVTEDREPDCDAEPEVGL